MHIGEYIDACVFSYIIRTVVRISRNGPDA